MAEDEWSCGIIHSLLQHGQDAVLEKIFLLLEPEELKACRQVCTIWNQFILEKLWGTKFGRNRIKKKLAKRWRESDSKAELLVKARSQVSIPFIYH